MEAERWRPWGKLSRTARGEVSTHALLDHMVDVASVFGALITTAAVRRALEVAAGRKLQHHDCARLQALVFLHDIGKANAGFQSRYWRTVSERPRYWHAEPRGHGPDGWALFTQSLHCAAHILEGLPIENMGSWGESVVPMLRASISHHGRPVGDAGASESAWHPVRDGVRLVYDPAEAVGAMGQRMLSLYPEAFDSEAPDLPGSPGFVHLFAGLVQLADWLGSDTREGFFPYTKPGEDRTATAPQRARHAVRAIGLDVGDATARQAVTRWDFAHAFGVSAPRPMQVAMADSAFGPVVVLEAETGSGKTEAALWRFLHLWRAGQVDSLYFALPTRVAATQLHERVQAFVKQAWTQAAPVVVRALPGNTAADGQGLNALPGFEVLWADHPEDAEAERRWAAETPKRYLAATIAVGTVDQALLGALRIKHAHLRQALLARSLLVVDEVHASDAYMTRLLEHLLRAHVACGGHALLLSATLGASARTRYLSIGSRRADSVPPLAMAQALPYPAIASRGATGPLLHPVEGNPRHKTVHWQLLDIIDTPHRIAGLAIEAAATGARVLVVRNTVPAAIATLHAAEALASAQDANCLFKVVGVSTLHHSRFSPTDRPLLDAEVQAQIGKRRMNQGGRVIIGTQTLEQSLDIDADLLITDLCPMDVLLQRLGRLHRHERPSQEAPEDRRPVGFEQPHAWVLTPPGHDLSPMLKGQRHGLGPIRRRGEQMSGVYVDLRVLEATRRLIAAQPTRNIPADNRLLVEQATHGEALDAIARELGADWENFGKDYEGGLAATTTAAIMHALPFAEAFDELEFPDDEGRLGSRLGAADRLVAFDPPLRGPFQQLVTQVAIRHHLLPRDLEPDARVQCVQPSPNGSGFTFSLGSAHYRYSRLGVERIKQDMRMTNDNAT